MVKLIVYDLDGTLIDSRHDITNAVNWMLQQVGRPTLPLKRISSFVGAGARNLIEQVLREAGDGDRATPQTSLDHALKIFRKRYGEHLLDQTQLYPSVRKVLEFFKDRKQAVITNKPQDFSLKILKGLGVDSYFFTVLGGDEGFPKKPAPQTLLEVLLRSGVWAKEAVVVGDSAIDIESGRNAGVKTVAVTYGFGTRAEIEKCQPHLILDDLAELMHAPL